MKNGDFPISYVKVYQRVINITVVQTKETNLIICQTTNQTGERIMNGWVTSHQAWKETSAEDYRSPLKWEDVWRKLRDVRCH